MHLHEHSWPAHDCAHSADPGFNQQILYCPGDHATGRGGKISLDASVQHYLLWFHVAAPLGPAATSTITVRHLLNQTSGIPTGRIVGVSVTGPGEETKEQAMRALAEVKPDAPRCSEMDAPVMLWTSHPQLLINLWHIHRRQVETRDPGDGNETQVDEHHRTRTASR